jgi:hypothetical protein
MNSPSILRRLTTMVASLGVLAAIGCTRTMASECTEQYSWNLGPEAHNNGVTLHLSSFTQSARGLRAEIIVANDSNARLELPAVDWKPTWLSVTHDGTMYPASMSFNDPVDVEQHWPDQLPLRSTVTVEPYHSVTYLIACTFPRTSAAHSDQTILMVHGLIGNDRKPIEVKLPVPVSPDHVSAADIASSNTSP